MEQNIYGGKYTWLQILKEKFGFKIPNSYLLSVKDLQKIFPCCKTQEDFQHIDTSDFFLDFLSKIEDSENGYIIRSSSSLEGFNEDFLELSGVYKSVVRQSKDMLFDGVKEILLYNFSEHITYIHSKNKYASWVYIPLIIQPLIYWDVAWVLMYETPKCHIEYSKGYNFWITDWRGTAISECDYDVGQWIVLSWTFPLELETLIKKSRVLFQRYQNFIVEFTIQNNELTLLQFKDTEKATSYKDYGEIYMSIIYLMKELGYWIDDFAIEENDTFLFYNYLGIRQTTNEDIQHIRILIYENKFKDFIYVREGSNDFIHPNDEYSQSLISDLFEKTTLKILFFHQYKDTSGGKWSFTFGNSATDKISFIYKGLLYNLNFFLDNDIGYYTELSNNKYEIEFFINRLNKFNYQNIFRTFKTKYENYRRIIEQWDLNSEFIQILKRFNKLNAIYLHIMVKNREFLEKKFTITTTESIAWKVLSPQNTNASYVCTYDILSVKKMSLAGKSIAFICEDFEPSRIMYLEYIHIVITKRPFKLSHGVIICREYNIPLIYDVKWTEYLNEQDTVSIDLTLWTIQKIS